MVRAPEKVPWVREEGGRIAGDTKRSVRALLVGRLTRFWLVSTGAITAIVVAAAFQVGRESTSRVAIGQARIVAGAMRPGPGGDLHDSVSQMRRECDDVIAVATVGVTGELLSIYPNRAGHRAALTDAVDRLRKGLNVSLNEPVSVTTKTASPNHGTPLRLTAVAVPLHGVDSPDSVSILVLLKEPEGMSAIQLATVMVGPIAFVLFLCVVAFHQWLDRWVCRPVRKLSKAMTTPATAADRRQRRAAGVWRELEVIGEQYERLLRHEAEVHKHYEQAQANAHERLKHREAGLDRKLRRAEDKALTDTMTRLRNRAFLELKLEKIFERQRDNGGNLCAIMLDLDHFKQHNDRYGHQSGDALIAFAGSLLSGSIRAEDIAFRYGGDEFLMLLPDINVRQAAKIVDRIVKMFGQYARQFGEEPFVSMSAGVSSLKRDIPTSGYDLVDKADRALYKAKNAGKNAVAIFSAA